MKLRTKMTVLVLFAMVSGFLAGGWYSIDRTMDYIISVAAENEKEKLSAIGNAFRQVGTRDDFERMGDIARDAYLKYQFERCYESGYALLKDGECIKNLTDYEIAAPEALKGEYMVQEIGGKHMLLLKAALEYPEGFEVLAAKDISSYWDGIREQSLRLSGGFFLIAAAAAFVTAFVAGRLLLGLAKLEGAARSIGRGELGTTVDIKSRDELGHVASVFNQMSVRIAGQVEDLHVLLGALAHEMKTPVTSIMGYADTLLHVRLSEEQKRKSLRNIYEAGLRMETMSAKLLALVGMYENGAIKTEEISVNQLLMKLTEVTKPVRAKKKTELFISCEEGLTLMGDEGLLLSLLSNLVQNSVKASGENGKIEIEAGKGRISVRDYGCGIPKEALPNVIKAFYMADKSRSRSEGGSGLGLALAERIAVLHGGRLEIESEEGVGTVVSLVFPAFRMFTKPLPSDEHFAAQIRYDEPVKSGPDRGRGEEQKNDETEKIVAEGFGACMGMRVASGLRERRGASGRARGENREQL